MFTLRTFLLTNQIQFYKLKCVLVNWPLRLLDIYIFYLSDRRGTTRYSKCHFNTHNRKIQICKSILYLYRVYQGFGHFLIWSWWFGFKFKHISGNDQVAPQKMMLTLKVFINDLKIIISLLLLWFGQNPWYTRYTWVDDDTTLCFCVTRIRNKVPWQL